MNEDGQLDLTSEALPSSPLGKPPTAASGPTSHAHAGTKPRSSEQSMRVFFHCCRVYAAVHVPQGVTNGRLSSWRFHCPRCGQLVQIPARRLKCKPTEQLAPSGLALNGVYLSRSGSRVDFRPPRFTVKTETLRDFRYKEIP